MDHTSGEKMSVAVEPIGGNGGDLRDDGIYQGVRKIELYHGDCIDWIQVAYDKNGKAYQAERHGGYRNPGCSVSPNAKIELKFPQEFLVSVRGHYGLFSGLNVIRSLTFKSNKRSYGPFGVEQGTPFTLSLVGVDVVGFKVRSGMFLDAIGFHLAMKEPTKSLQSA